MRYYSHRARIQRLIPLLLILIAFVLTNVTMNLTWATP